MANISETYRVLRIRFLLWIIFAAIPSIVDDVKSRFELMDSFPLAFSCCFAGREPSQYYDLNAPKFFGKSKPLAVARPAHSKRPPCRAESYIDDLPFDCITVNAQFLRIEVYPGSFHPFAPFS